MTNLAREWVPLWVYVLYVFLEWLDYRVLAPLSSKILYWRVDLWDRYCACEKCRRRKAEKEAEK